MACVLRIVAVIGAWGRDEFLYYATPADAEAARQLRTRATRSPSDHVDLLVFATGKPGISDDDGLTDSAAAVGVSAENCWPCCSHQTTESGTADA
jgi:hypothetical protein